jgi:hypothetical protein
MKAFSMLASAMLAAAVALPAVAADQTKLYDPMAEAEKIVITDMCDRLILDTCGYFINSCPNQEFCKEIHPFLIPIQMGEKDAGEVLSVSRDVSEQYFREEDEAATMAEIGMM